MQENYGEGISLPEVAAVPQDQPLSEMHRATWQQCRAMVRHTLSQAVF